MRGSIRHLPGAIREAHAPHSESSPQNCDPLVSMRAFSSLGSYNDRLRVKFYPARPGIPLTFSPPDPLRLNASITSLNLSLEYVGTFFRGVLTRAEPNRSCFLDRKASIWSEHYLPQAVKTKGCWILTSNCSGV